MLQQCGRRKHALSEGLLELFRCDLVRVILRWLELDREVAGYLIEERLFKLLEHLLCSFTVESTIRAHIRHKHEVGEVEADQKIARVLLTFNTCQNVLDEDDRMIDTVQEHLFLDRKLLVNF